MNLDSVVSPQALNKYLILVDVKSGRFKYQSGRVAKSVSLPLKVGELASMHIFELLTEGIFPLPIPQVLFSFLIPDQGLY